MHAEKDCRNAALVCGILQKLAGILLRNIESNVYTTIFVAKQAWQSKAKGKRWKRKNLTMDLSKLSIFTFSNILFIQRNT